MRKKTGFYCLLLSLFFGVVFQLTIPPQETALVPQIALNPLQVFSASKEAMKSLESVVVVKVSKPSAVKEVIGSGIIVSSEGHVLTARHVIKGFKEIKVQLKDGVKLQAELVYEDSSLDLALLKVSSSRSLTSLSLGPVAEIRIGEEVSAIGHPFGYLYTVSSGVVSGLDREIEMPTGERIRGLIQTDAAVNPGNSGGPLINAQGEVIGVVLALRTDAQSIGFALHVDVVRKALEGKWK